MTENRPKAFISYSWSSPDHRDLIREYAERLVADGVDVVLDQWDLVEGQDKYAFMEKMVTDTTVTRVLVFSDRLYAEKADSRVAGVGTESQIMSREIYERVEQTKFIPLVCERDENGEPCLPTFLKSRKWIDFSSYEKVNENWQQLIRVLYGKPMLVKPEVGPTPAYIMDVSSSPLPTLGKLATLREALIKRSPIVANYRSEFIDAGISYLDSLRTLSNPESAPLDEKVLADLRSMLPLRDHFVEWIHLEASSETEQLDALLVEFLERVIQFRFPPEKANNWSESWADAHRIFAHEIFLYTISALIRAKRFATVGALLSAHYLLPQSQSDRGRDFAGFGVFYAYSNVLAARNATLKKVKISPVAEIIRERATRRYITFAEIMQAEGVLFLAAMMSEGQSWYPGTLIYSNYGCRFPLFLRAAQKRYFVWLKTMLGVPTGDELRQRFDKRFDASQWSDFTFYADVQFHRIFNLASLDTLD